jgi:hypothetical protein
MKLGDIARDRITGFEGVLVAHTRHLTNVDRWTIHPREVKDGKPVAGRSFDVGLLEYVGESGVPVTPTDRPAEPVELGDTVRLHVSGLEGVVTAITTWSEGCAILNVQPKVLKDGVPVDAVGADERGVDVVSRANPKPAVARTGGPRSEPSRGRSENS